MARFSHDHQIVQVMRDSSLVCSGCKIQFPLSITGMDYASSHSIAKLFSSPHSTSNRPPICPAMEFYNGFSKEPLGHDSTSPRIPNCPSPGWFKFRAAVAEISSLHWGWKMIIDRQDVSDASSPHSMLYLHLRSKFPQESSFVWELWRDWFPESLFQIANSTFIWSPNCTVMDYSIAQPSLFNRNWWSEPHLSIDVTFTWPPNFLVMDCFILQLTGIRSSHMEPDWKLSSYQPLQHHLHTTTYR